MIGGSVFRTSVTRPRGAMAMTSMPRVGLAVLFLFALQGCEDKGTCETEEYGEKKETKEACCKDGKPGEGPRPSSPRGTFARSG